MIKTFAIVTSVFVAIAPLTIVEAKTNIEQLVVDAQNAGTVLKWAISKEGSADFKTRPYNYYNITKKAIEVAESAAQKLSNSEKLSVQAKLVEPKIHVKRAQAYIDGITSSEKIIQLTNNLQEAIDSADLDKIETIYHTATEEYRKQAKLLDRVYGQSTRSGIRNKVKPVMEKQIAKVKYDVTVKMYLDKAKSFIHENKLVEAAIELEEADSYLSIKEAKFTFKKQLLNSYSEILASLPLKPLSISSDSKNTITINFSKVYSIPLEELGAGQFKVSGETIQSAILSDDKKSVILTTSDLNPATNYTFFWKSYLLNFVTASVPDTSGITLNELDQAYIETTNSRTYTAKLTNADGTPYIGRVNISLLDVSSASQTTAVITSINGGTTNSGQEWVATTDMKGNLVYTIAAATRANEYTPSVTYVQPTIQKLDGDQQSKKAPITHFYQLQYVNDSYLLTIDANPNHLAKDYIFANDFKYKWDSNDYFFIRGQKVSQEVFESALSTGDTLNVDYKVKTENSTSWNLVVNVTNAAKLRISNPATSIITYDGIAYDISGTGQAGYSVKVYRNDIYIGRATVDTKGNWTVGSVSLMQHESNIFKAYQYAPGKDGDNGTGSENLTNPAMVTINEGAFASTEISLHDIENNGITINDTLNFTFRNPSYGHRFKQTLTGTITLKDNQGRTSMIKVDYEDGQTLKVVDFISLDSNFDNGPGIFITATTGIVSQDQLAFDIAESNVNIR